jgi:hypothetical protein
MDPRREQTQEEIDIDHLNGEHFADPHPLCWQCEEDGRPESPDP